MITWVKLDAGEYESTDKRFYILKTYDRLYGNHWALHDENNPDSQYHEYTLKECKLKAETIVKVWDKLADNITNKDTVVGG